MNLYLLTQKENNGYDTYDSIIVSANSIDEAKLVLPDSDYSRWGDSTWATGPENVTAALIGIAIKDISEVHLASFNAG